MHPQVNINFTFFWIFLVFYKSLTIVYCLWLVERKGLDLQVFVCEALDLYRKVRHLILISIIICGMI